MFWFSQVLPSGAVKLPILFWAPPATDYIPSGHSTSCEVFESSIGNTHCTPLDTSPGPKFSLFDYILMVDLGPIWPLQFAKIY